MTEDAKLKPPYVSAGPTNKLLDLLRRQTPSKIDSKFVVDNNLTSMPNAWTIVRLAEWLGLINDAGETVPEKIKILKLSGSEKEKQMAGLIRESYKDLFDRIDIDKATKDDIFNYFVNTWNFGNRQAEIATSLFLHLCQSYNIPVSEELKKKIQTRGVKKKESSEKTSRKRRETSASKSVKKIETDQTVEDKTNLIKAERTGMGIEIVVRSFGIEANPHTTIIARSRNELQNKLEGEFKAFMGYVMLLFKEDSA